MCDVDAAVLVIQPRNQVVLDVAQLGFPFDVVVKTECAGIFVIAESVIVQARCIRIAEVKLRVIGGLMGKTDTLVKGQALPETMGQFPAERLLRGFKMVIIRLAIGIVVGQRPERGIEILTCDGAMISGVLASFWTCPSSVSVVLSVGAR